MHILYTSNSPVQVKANINNMHMRRVTEYIQRYYCIIKSRLVRRKLIWRRKIFFFVPRTSRWEFSEEINLRPTTRLYNERNHRAKYRHCLQSRSFSFSCHPPFPLVLSFFTHTNIIIIVAYNICIISYNKRKMIYQIRTISPHIRTLYQNIFMFTFYIYDAIYYTTGLFLLLFNKE